MPLSSVSKKTRFEVFKRDGFRCQYCGAMAPDVLLEVDHIHPRSKGGGGDILNLLTSCEACNRGKGKRILSDQATLKKQQAQLTELHERRLQLEELLRWREDIKDVEDENATKLLELLKESWRTAAALPWPSFFLESLTRNKEMKRLVKKFGIPAVLDAIEIAEATYVLERDFNSLTQAWYKLGGICYLTTCSKEQKEAYELRKRLMMKAQQEILATTVWSCSEDD